MRNLLIALALIVAPTVVHAQAMRFPAANAGGGGGGGGCSTGGCSMLGNILFTTSTGTCFDDQPSQCMTGDGAGGYLWTDISGNVIMNYDFGSGLFAAAGLDTAGALSADGAVTLGNAVGDATTVSGTLSVGSTSTISGTMTFSAVTTDITSGLNEDITIDPNGTGDVVLNGPTVADNQANAESIFIAKDNGTAVLTIADGGDVFGATATGTYYLETSNGSNTAPTYSYTNDQNTGMYRSAADEVSITTNGAQRFSVSSTGMTMLSIGTIYSGATADITSGSNEDITIDPNGTGDVALNGEVVITPEASHAGNALLITAGTQASNTQALRLTATLNGATAATQFGAGFNITSAGSAATRVVATSTNLIAGYTGSASTEAAAVSNAVAGIGTTPLAALVGNQGITSSVSGAGTGHNVGGNFLVSGSSARNMGVVGQVAAAGDGTTENIGVYGTSSGATATNIGGMFTLYGASDTIGTLTGAALYADNAASTDPIFLARDNGTTVFTIADGGAVTATARVASTRFHTTTVQAATCAAGVLALTPTAAVVDLDANAAACVVTLAEPASGFLNDTVTIFVRNAGAGVVTFPDVANVHNGPTLCTTTGVGTDSVYVVLYSDQANDILLGQSCSAN